jgi:hypothetical protein
MRTNKYFRVDAGMFNINQHHNITRWQLKQVLLKLGVVIWGQACRCKCGGCDIDLEHIYCKNLTWPHTYDAHACMLMMWNLCGKDVAPMWWWHANWECIGNICSHVGTPCTCFRISKSHPHWMVCSCVGLPS